MLTSLVQDVISSKNVTFLHGAHWFAKRVLKSEGYSWELRRNGDLKLGYWRKSLKNRNHRNPYPKRFVVVPGFGDTPLSWYLVIVLLHPILKKNFDEIILFDFPGFSGFLSRERAFPSMDLMMSTLHDALDSLKPHTILGHSLGAWLASYYAAHCGAGQRPVANKLNYAGPDTVILADPSGIFTDANTRKEWEAIFRTSMREGFSILRPHLFAKEPAWFRLIVPNFSHFLKREDVIQFMESFREEHAIAPVAHQIRSKVWLLWGEKDTLIPASCAAAWLQHLDENLKDTHRAVFIKGAGHSPQVEKPAATAIVIGQILSNKTPHRFGKRWWTVVRNETRKVVV